jgi:pantoate--beta-alanine ligase
LKLAHEKEEVRRIVTGWRRHGKRVALVPTMGALHEGHLSLVRQARKNADHVVVSVFVNPTQFGPEEDFEQYPRTLESDLQHCRKEGVSLVFAPGASEMYGAATGGSPQNFLTFRISKMAEHLCGPFRPGHFEGVLLVVNKLFNIVQPDAAIFGQKDIQQWFLIRQMAVEMDIPVDVLMGPTQREPDGLARSSRNVYLAPDERKIAPMLFEALQKVRRHLDERCVAAAAEASGQAANGPAAVGVPIDPAIISEEINRLYENGFHVEYFSLVDTPDLQPADVIEPGRIYVIATAARLGKTRLIDNVLFTYKDSQTHDA